MPRKDLPQERALEHIPEALLAALEPLLEQIASLTERIREYDRRLEAITLEHYPESALLRQVEGIGPLTALTFVLTLEDPYRFEKSRSVGAYSLGLVPATDRSGDTDPQKRISKEGNEMLSGSSWWAAPTGDAPAFVSCHTRPRCATWRDSSAPPTNSKEVVPMRRIMVVLTVALVMAGLLALSALPVMAVNSGNQPPGPPFQSGSPNTEGAKAFHCKTIGAKGASVTNKNGQPTRCR